MLLSQGQVLTSEAATTVVERDDFRLKQLSRSTSLYDRMIQTYGDAAFGHHALGVSGGVGQQQWVYVQLSERATPFGVVLTIEQQSLVGRDGQPGVLLDFLIELTWPPAGITER